MSGLRIDYARVSTDAQDLTAQRDALQALGVEPERIYVDHGFTGTHRDRPGLRQALAACRTGDELVLTKLDRLARSLPDARATADEPTSRQVKRAEHARPLPLDLRRPCHSTCARQPCTTPPPPRRHVVRTGEEASARGARAVP